MPDFLQRRFFAFGIHKVMLPNIPAPLMSGLFNTHRADVNLPLGTEIDGALAATIDSDGHCVTV